MRKNTVLIVLDGFGINCPENKDQDAIQSAVTPTFDKLMAKYPHSLLKASGESVGLPEGQMGNSEVGHLNIGSGRIVYQEFTRISKSIREGDFFSKDAFLEAIDHVKKHGSSLHLFGLLSDGGVHSHITHLMALLDLAKLQGLSKVYVHGFLDGRDVPPRSALTYIQSLQDHMERINLGKIATLSGRYYAMDRDNRWDRVKLAYDAIAQGQGVTAPSAEDAIHRSYSLNETDEFLKPTILLDEGLPTALVSENDAIINFNFRPDRAREITRTFVDKDFNKFEKQFEFNNLCYVCMTQYDATMPHVLVAYRPQVLINTLGEYIASLGLKQLRIAETEKYAHVTFFFNGGVEAPNANEDRILIPSPKVATYDLKPSMSALEVTDRVIHKINENIYDLIVINFANPDMVGHTGNFEATVKAIEFLDTCVDRIVEAVQKNKGELLITSDHGNADSMIDNQGNIITAHSLNPVPVIYVTDKDVVLEEGLLADIAPTLLSIMGLPIPAEMAGHSLIKEAAPAYSY
ncbi:MAG: 2,3-bisphosphoglycerate-independent phosphoglycerate mutase [Peptostreptococcales bacterium]